VQDLAVYTELGQPNLLIDVDRARSARFGLAPGDVNAVVEAAIGGKSVTDVFEGERHFPLVVRLAPEYRRDVEAIKTIPVAAVGQAATAYVPLGDLSRVHMASGASYIYRENNARYLPVKFSVRGRDLGSTVAEAQARVERSVSLPDGYHTEWSGEFGELEEAQ